MQSRRHAWVALGLAFSVNPRYRDRIDLDRILEWKDPSRFLKEMPRILHLRPLRSKAIVTRDFSAWADKEIRSSRDAGTKIVTIEDAAYPSRLRRLPDPPVYLYAKGDLPSDDTLTVALVGSRRPTPYGRRVACILGRELGTRGAVVVSGAARGIDTAAHRGALEAGGPTLGVLGTGLDVVYPRENHLLFKEIPDSGALLTEYPFGAAPLAFHFPVRNRIIAGLSEAVVVIEAARDSGSLITARLAADELGIPVGAVPGPITSVTSAGCNDLLYDGATPVRDVRDILDMLPSGRRQKLEAARDGSLSRRVTHAEADMDGLEGAACRVLEALSSDEPRGAEDLAAALKLASGRVLGHLLDLEIRGLATQDPGGRYLRNH